MRRCEHSVYIPKGSEKALYCSFCNPGGPKNTRDIVLPISGIGHPTKLRANGKNSGEACPQCGAEIWMEKKGAVVECAECGETYRRKNTRKVNTEC